MSIILLFAQRLAPLSELYLQKRNQHLQTIPLEEVSSTVVKKKKCWFEPWVVCPSINLPEFSPLSISYGSSGWKRGESTAKSQTLHHHSARGSGNDPCGGIHVVEAWGGKCMGFLTELHFLLTFVPLWFIRKWRICLRTTTVRRSLVSSLHTTITGTLHSNRIRMLNRWVFCPAGWVFWVSYTTVFFKFFFFLHWIIFVFFRRINT